LLAELLGAEVSVVIVLALGFLPPVTALWQVNLPYRNSDTVFSRVLFHLSLL